METLKFQITKQFYTLKIMLEVSWYLISNYTPKSYSKYGIGIQYIPKSMELKKKTKFKLI